MTLSGSLDLSESSNLKLELERVISSEIKIFRIKANDLSYIDSSGVACLLYLRKLCIRFDVIFVIDSISQAATRIIRLAKLDAVLDLPSSASDISKYFELDKPSNINATPEFSNTDALSVFQENISSFSVENTDKNSEEKSSLSEITPPSFS